ncbi:hypothetical protein PFISCL1PPCAC_6162, partial [Pristionchus fissidentatus]
SLQMFDQSIDPRRQYRSVAYGTWKVGDARALMNARSTEDVNRIVRNMRTLDSSHLNSSQFRPRLHLNSLRMGESNPCLHSLGRSPPQDNPLLSPQMTTSLFSPVDDSSRFHPSIPLSRDDCYSSNEYVVYKSQENILDSLNCNGDHGDNSSLGPSSHNSRALANSLQRSHYRSASAGAESSYRVNGLHAMEKTMEEEKKGGERRESKKSGVFNGAKQFLKKMYNSATLPSKKNSISNGSIGRREERSEERNGGGEPMYENVHNVSYPSYIFPSPLHPPSSFPSLPSSPSFPSHPSASSSSHSAHQSSSLSIDTHSSSQMDRIDDYRSQLATTCNYSQRDDGVGPSYADSGVMDESSSSPDESLSSITTTRLSETDDNNWDDLLMHLKKELLLMRERDAQILADLHKVESQLQSVRMNTFLDSP